MTGLNHLPLIPGSTFRTDTQGPQLLDSSNTGLQVCIHCAANYQFTVLGMGVVGGMTRDGPCPVHPTVASYNLRNLVHLFINISLLFFLFLSYFMNIMSTIPCSMINKANKDPPLLLR